MDVIELNIPDDVRNYQVTNGICPELKKKSEEYYALAVLKYCDKLRFLSLHKAESPDLQDDNGILGIEVTNAESPRDQQINGESIKYRHAKTEEEQEKSLRIILRNGGDRNAYCTTYPTGTDTKELKNIQNAYCKKLKKLNMYREKCTEVGLVIRIDVPICILGDAQWGNLLHKENEDGFDFVALLHWSGMDIYEMKTGKYSLFKIEREDMDNLKKLGRMAAEGKIKDDDPVWQ